MPCELLGPLGLFDLHPQLMGIPWMDPNWLLERFGNALFWISLGIVFVECGLLFPFLPGDTLLFALGLFISATKVDLIPGGTGVELLVTVVALTGAAFLGNLVGYEIGRRIGPPLYAHQGRVIRREHLDKTHDFFEKHGSKALVIGRFVPFVRTFVTVVAGVSQMDRRHFWTWSLVGAALWVTSITLLGFFLGEAFPGIGGNLDLAIVVILAFSLAPLAVEWLRHRRATD